jgi:Na+/H+ antiporter NhaD/arsenite permease-like protein
MVDVAALIIFLVTYAIIAIQKIPRVHISRAAGALIGAVAMGLFGVLSPHEAYQAIDLDTIVFLLGMMIVVAHLEIAGFFEILELWILKRARSQRGLLALVIASSGLLSALFMNDTICLMFTPVLVRLVQRLHLDPVPYLLGLVLSANAGSMATLIGNPQNMLIGLRSGLSFVEFFIALGPAALLSLAAIYIIIVVLFRGSLRGALPETPDLPEYHELSWQRGLLMVSLANLALFLGLLIVGVSPQWAAISCAALILVLASNRPRRALQYCRLDALVVICGLFIVMRGLEATSWLDRVIERAGPLLGAPGLGGLLALIALTVLVSNLVSNVPAVLLLAPILARVGAGAESWLSVAMAATLAGNLTIIGSAANLIVLELASQRGVHISFWTYLKVGLPVTLVTIAISTAWLIVRP